jgi:hypothetical protein
MHTLCLLGVAVSSLVCQALQEAIEQTQRPSSVHKQVLVKLNWPNHIQRFKEEQFQPLGVTHGSLQLESAQRAPAAAVAPAAQQQAADATKTKVNGNSLPRKTSRGPMVPRWPWMLQQTVYEAAYTAASPTRQRGRILSLWRELRQLPTAVLTQAAETSSCKQVVADDETYIIKCPGSAPAIIDRSTPAQNRPAAAAAAGGNSTKTPAQGCKAGTTCAVVLSAVLPVVAAIIGAAGGIYAACIRKKKPAPEKSQASQPAPNNNSYDSLGHTAQCANNAQCPKAAMYGATVCHGAQCAQAQAT